MTSETERETIETGTIGLIEYPEFMPQPQQELVIRRRKGRKYSHADNGKKILLDEYKEPYFAQGDSDTTKPMPISLPESLRIRMDKYIDKLRTERDIKRRQEGLSRSRYIRHLIQEDLDKNDPTSISTSVSTSID